MMMTPQSRTHLRSLRDERLTFCGRWIHDEKLTVRNAIDADCPECFAVVEHSWGVSLRGRALRDLAADYRAKPLRTAPTTDELLAAADEMARTFRVVWGTAEDMERAGLGVSLAFNIARARYMELRGIKP